MLHKEALHITPDTETTGLPWYCPCLHEFHYKTPRGHRRWNNLSDIFSIA